MNDPADVRFFRALKQICSQSGDVDQSCREAIDRAVETGHSRDLLSARQSMDALDAALKDRLLQQAHLIMATDISAIWDALPMAADPSKRRPN
ncbi:hypothetical protein [Primorskyibacter marinus]|uniref:hypothetical protein n=1 Tax=Primorskyibacter marinus TaxID=1977320 RepID=UPI000E304376|nr:hypothetical protein [Primorskyibacter marinus]